MKVNELCRPRWQLPNKQCSPLLVPSYSSKGFKHILQIFNLTSPYNTRAYLVSAYDIYHRCLPLGATSLADQVFIDSGGYESRMSGLFEPFGDHRTKRWSLSRYYSVLKSLEKGNDLVAVSYDMENGDYGKQIKKALAMRDRFPELKLDILIKPEKIGRSIDVDAICSRLNVLQYFSCIGVTERELGDSMLLRCRALIKMRERLNAIGSDVPIHVFGCFDIPSILALFFCGADVFDGLTWLKYSLDNGSLKYFGEIRTENEYLHLADDDCLKLMMARNIEHLRKLQKGMREYCDSFDMAKLPISNEMKEKLSSLLLSLYIEV
jgi:hypothetical protein